MLYIYHVVCVLFLHKTTGTGNTRNDFEVAQQLEVDCILVADGHQSKERLEATGAKVIDDLQQLKTLPF
ncbi:hypothetical protein [Draconibacterium sediminis]|uniref:Uncharacterized protein n=1 Tax=Draconibacterium sediminis TaxID=1544798 RepID=A0A0D8J574_9BACT|nr:hypothetical protein [Draconibacterium sediminis]KJF41899.1 hypothetical protein LH29_23515 [Draconibacterium sediminis]